MLCRIQRKITAVLQPYAAFIPHKIHKHLIFTDILRPGSVEREHRGDLVFFVGTYDTAGMSHVGLYVGNSVMLHCGDPISYTNLNSSYWQQHFYCYGRLP